MSALSYYIHDGPAAFRFQLFGDLSGEGIRDLEQTWRTASSVIGERRLVVDLSSVSGLDQDGCELLARWQVEGALFTVTSLAAKERVEALIQRPIELLGKSARRHRWTRFRETPWWIASLIGAFCIRDADGRSRKVCSHSVNFMDTQR